MILLLQLATVLPEIAGTQCKVKQQIEPSHMKLHDREIGSQLSYLQSRNACQTAQYEYARAKDSIYYQQVKKISTITDREAFHLKYQRV